MYNFTLINCDTDAVTICKPDGANFTDEEIKKLTDELNSLYEDSIKWEFEFNLPRMVILKAKNYVYQYADGKVIYKGSAIKATPKEPALREFIKRIIGSLLEDKNDFKEVYDEYVKEALAITDIKRWSVRKTISEKTLDPKRSNEQKVKDIIEGTEYVEGDRIYCFYMPDTSLKLVENFDGVYCKSTLLKKLYNTAEIFSLVLDTDKYFTNYSLSKHFTLLDPEQAIVKKAQSKVKRLEAKERKDLQSVEDSDNMV